MFSIKTCQECGVRFHKDYGQEVEGDYVAWYCDQHKKPYDLAFRHEVSGRTVYERVLEVRITDGMPIGYVTEAMYREGGREADRRYRALQEIADELKRDLEATQASEKSLRSIKRMDEQYIKYLEGQLLDLQKKADKTKKRKV